MRLRRSECGSGCSCVATVLARSSLAVCGDGRDDDDDSAGGDDGGATDRDHGRRRRGRGRRRDVRDRHRRTCITDPTTVEITGDTIKLGTSLPQSGIYAAFNEILRGRAGVHRVRQREKGGFDVGGKKYQVELVAKDDDVRRSRTDGRQRAIADQRRRGVRAVQRRRHEEQPRDPRPRERGLRAEPVRRDRFARVGQPDYPWLEGTVPRAVPARDAGARRLPRRRTSPPQRSRSCAPTTTSAGRTPRRSTVADRGHRPHDRRAEETYDPETGEVATQVTTLAASEADVFVLGATLLGVPRRSTSPARRVEADRVHVGDVHVEDADGGGRRRTATTCSVSAPLMDPTDPQYATNEAMKLYKEQVKQYQPDADARTASSRTAGRRGAARRRRSK